MSGPRATINTGQRHGEQIARSTPFEWLARAGLLARGVIYGLIGLLAFELAIGAGGSTTSQQGALHEIAQQPFGKVLLVLTAIGLAGYSIWRFVRAAIGHGTEDSESTLERLGGVVSGIGYAILCATAIEILIGSGGGGTSQTTGGILGWPGGVWIVGIAGIVTIGEGLEQGYRGFSKKFLEKSKTVEMSAAAKTWFTRIGVLGHLARMVVFVLIGYFLVKAAIDYNPDAAVSLDGALTKVASASYGPVLLGIVAAGLAAFGLYSILDSRYRKV
jgi:hypothetical protein